MEAFHVWAEGTVHTCSKRFKDEGTLYPLDRILDTNDFRSNYWRIAWTPSI
jgi:hypothetical protein